MEYHKCRVCNNTYETHTVNDSKSRHPLSYARYLGFCNSDCWGMLTRKEQSVEHLFAYVYGDTRKRNNLKYIIKS